MNLEEKPLTLEINIIESLGVKEKLGDNLKNEREEEKNE